MISRRAAFAFALSVFILMLAMPAQIPDQPSGCDAVLEAVGARDFFYCAMFQSLQVIGLITANAGLVVAGAIGGGLACGFAI